jgi:CRISPR-associated protein Csd2
MFDVDRSAARGEMAERKLVIFEHDSPLGNAPAHELFDRITIKRVDESRPARTYGDYSVVIDKGNLPDGIVIHEV